MFKHRLPPRFLDLLESASQRDRDQFFNSLLVFRSSGAGLPADASGFESISSFGLPDAVESRLTVS